LDFSFIFVCVLLLFIACYVNVGVYNVVVFFFFVAVVTEFKENVFSAKRKGSVYVNCVPLFKLISSKIHFKN